MHPTTLMFFWAVSLAEVRQGMIDRTAWDDYFSWCADNYSCVPHGVVHDFLASHAVWKWATAYQGKGSHSRLA